MVEIIAGTLSRRRRGSLPVELLHGSGSPISRPGVRRCCSLFKPGLPAGTGASPVQRFCSPRDGSSIAQAGTGRCGVRSIRVRLGLGWSRWKQLALGLKQGIPTETVRLRTASIRRSRLGLGFRRLRFLFRRSRSPKAEAKRPGLGASAFSRLDAHRPTSTRKPFRAGTNCRHNHTGFGYLRSRTARITRKHHLADQTRRPGGASWARDDCVPQSVINNSAPA